MESENDLDTSGAKKGGIRLIEEGNYAFLISETLKDGK